MKKSALEAAVYMIKDGYEACDELPFFIKFFLDESQNKKMGRLLCKLVSVSSFEEARGILYEGIYIIRRK